MAVEGWLSRMCSSLAGGGEAAGGVHALLRRAQRSRTPVELELRAEGPENPTPLKATIEQVFEDGFIISQPLKKGRVHPLARYEMCRLIVHDRRRRMVGWTQVLGRMRVTSGGGGVLYGYRLAVPERMTAAPRQTQTRRGLPRRPTPEAELIIPGRSGAIYGQVRDINDTGASLSCRNAPDDLHCGEHVHLKLDLPGAVGQIREKVNIIDVFHDAGSGTRVVRVRFRRKIGAIADALRRGALRDLQLRRSA